MKKTAAMLLLVLLTAGCAKTPAQTAKTEQMPQDFAICFTWWYNPEQKNSMDTATGKLQKDLLADGTASAEFQPDDALRQQLYELVSRDDFLSISREMTAQELTTDGTAVAVSPNTCYEIAVTMNGKQTVVRGDQTAAAYTDTDEDAACFMAVTDELKQIVWELPAWKAMPEADGAYQ